MIPLEDREPPFFMPSGLVVNSSSESEPEESSEDMVNVCSHGAALFISEL